MICDHQEIVERIERMPDIEKLRLVDFILEQLDHPDSEIDRLWIKEASNRWKDYKEGKSETLSYEEVLDRYRL